MNLAIKAVITVFILSLAVAGVLSAVLDINESDISQSVHDLQIAEINRGVQVGQSFIAAEPDLTAVSVYLIPMADDENITSTTVYLHLRESVESGDDIRVAEIEINEITDAGFYTFKFEPVADSKFREYFFSLSAPEGNPGQAVSVGAAHGNLYQSGRSYVARMTGAQGIDPDIMALSRQGEIDLAFVTYHKTSLQNAILLSFTKGFDFIKQLSSDGAFTSLALIQITLPAVMLLVCLLLIRQDVYGGMTSRRNEKEVVFLFLSFLFIGAFGLRLMYAFEVPFSSDEGSYLYDAKLYREGSLAAGDGYVKAPLLIGWLILWQSLLGDFIYAGRFAAVIIGTLTMFPVYFIGKYLWDRRSGIAAASIWALSGPSVLYSVYVHNHLLAVFFAICGLSLLLMIFNKNKAPRKNLFDGKGYFSQSEGYKPKFKPGLIFAILTAGFLSGLGVLAKTSVIIIVLLSLAVISNYVKSWRKVFYSALFSIGFLAVIAPYMWLVRGLYKDAGIMEFLGINSANEYLFMRSATDYIAGALPFFYEAKFIILLFLIGMGIALEKLLRGILKDVAAKHSLKPNFIIEHIVAKFLWLAPITIFLSSWFFFAAHQNGLPVLLSHNWLWYLSLLILCLFTIWPRPSEESMHASMSKGVIPYSTQPNVLRAHPWKKLNTQNKNIKSLLVSALFIPVWLIGLFLFYANWAKFSSNELSEFILPVILLAGFGAALYFDRIKWFTPLAIKVFGVKAYTFILFAPLCFVILMTMLTANYASFILSGRGELEQDAVREATHWAKNNIPIEENIFTGQTLIPYLSGHQTALNISHPRWYGYEYITSNEHRLETFLPSVRHVQEAFDESQWVLLDKQTDFAFMAADSFIEHSLANQFEAVKAIENGDNPLIFYRRR